MHLSEMLQGPFYHHNLNSLILFYLHSVLAKTNKFLFDYQKKKKKNKFLFFLEDH